MGRSEKASLLSLMYIMTNVGNRNLKPFLYIIWHCSKKYIRQLSQCHTWATQGRMKEKTDI